MTFVQTLVYGYLRGVFEPMPLDEFLLASVPWPSRHRFTKH
jgi:hypothetical protein